MYSCSDKDQQYGNNNKKNKINRTNKIIITKMTIKIQIHHKEKIRIKITKM